MSEIRVVAVTPNPAVDVTYRVAEQRLGETVRVQEVLRRPGGKGVNVARVLAALDRPVLAVQPLGGPAGQWLEQALQADGLEVLTVASPTETRTTVAVDDGRTHPTLYAEPGPAQSEAVWAALVEAVGTSARPRGWVVVSGSLPPGTDPSVAGDLVTAARAAGARVLVDTSGPALLAAAAAGADLLSPNAAEAVEATGAGDLDGAVDRLLAEGAGAVVVSRGPGGLLARTSRGERLTQPAVPDVEGNPTGAGDAATAGLVDALGRGHSLADALREAAVLGAAAVLSPAAGDVDPAVLDTLRARLPATTPPEG